jgi:thiosulfate dehydrogenase
VRSALLALAVGACGGGGGAERERASAPAGADGAPSRDAARASAVLTFSPATWTPPPDSAIPADSLGASIRRGLALVTNTTDSLPAHAPGRINCTSCHLDGGRRPEAAPLAGAHARFPKYMERTGAVITLADRVNYCFTRSLAGSRIPADSREMEDILAYLAFLSTGVPTGTRTGGTDGLVKMAALVGDSARGAAEFARTCAACHGADGQGGVGRVPALWGPASYSVGASMAREERAASFIWHNMPLGQGRTLTPQQAYDLSAYINAHPRPDSPGKENDWPAGGAPRDVPYATVGHAAYRPPPLLPRRDPAGAVVPKPAPVAKSRPASAPRRSGGDE